MLTVRRLLAETDTVLQCGETGLDAPVRWVHLSELADPTAWLSGGELLLTTGMALTTPEEQRAYVTRLADHGLAGVGFGVGFAHETVPEAMLEAARERDFVLFEVPYETPFIAITEHAFTHLVNEQYAVLQRSIAAQERLQRIVLGERGLDAIVSALSTLIGGAALVFDGRGEPLAASTFRRRLPDELAGALSSDLHDRARRGDGRGFAPALGELTGRALALPVAAAESPARAGLPLAWLVGIKDGGGLEEFDRLVLHQAVTVIALELLRRRVADSTERRLAGDVLSGVVGGELTGQELTRRLEPFGLGGRISTLVVGGSEPGAAAALEQPLAEALEAEAVSGLVAVHGQYACALMPGFLDEELFDLAERLVARLPAGRMTVRAGAGRAVPAGRARESYHEARCALEALTLGASAPDQGHDTNGGANGHGTNGHANGAAPPRRRVATYRDLGSFQLLLSLQDTDSLRLFCESLLAPIEQGEGHYGGELLRSLEAFIDENGQWERAARRLYCHRHTLRYRIRKIEELTGRDLGSARDRIEFWLALRGREIVSTTHQ